MKPSTLTDALEQATMSVAPAVQRLQKMAEAAEMEARSLRLEARKKRSASQATLRLHLSEPPITVGEDEAGNARASR